MALIFQVLRQYHQTMCRDDFRTSKVIALDSLTQSCQVAASAPALKIGLGNQGYFTIHASVLPGVVRILGRHASGGVHVKVDGLCELQQRDVV